MFGISFQIPSRLFTKISFLLILNTVSYGTFISLKSFYVHAATKKDIEMCLYKIHLHARRGVDTLVKLCTKQNIPLEFESYITFFEILRRNCPVSENDIYLLWDCTPNKKTVCNHQKIWENLKQQLLAKGDQDVTINFQYFLKKDVGK